MTNERMTRAEMIRWLGDAISTESEKPFEEIDCDFVDECGQLLDELMGKSAAMSEEEITERMKKLKPDLTSIIRKKTGSRNLWKIAVAAAVVMCISVSAMAVPAWRQAVLVLLDPDVGMSLEESGITYIYNGREIQYSSLEEALSEDGKLSFLPPLIQSESLRSDKADSIPETNSISLRNNGTSISYEILLNQNDITSYIDNAIAYVIDDYTTYIVSVNPEVPRYYSYTVNDNDLYISNDIKDIEVRINSIN